MKYLLGVDFGGSSSKATLLREDGVVAATASREYPTYYPENGWAEQDRGGQLQRAPAPTSASCWKRPASRPRTWRRCALDGGHPHRRAAGRGRQAGTPGHLLDGHPGFGRSGALLKREMGPALMEECLQQRIQPLDAAAADVAEKARAGDPAQNPQGAGGKGLCPLPHDRRLRHRHHRGHGLFAAGRAEESSGRRSCAPWPGSTQGLCPRIVDPHDPC